MNIIEAIREPILAELKQFEATFLEALRTENPLLSSVHEYILQGSGKKLRPMLVLLAAKMCGEVNSATINGALSLELLHTASLIHDDVVDDTLERRGRPSINAFWNNKIAILSGDYMLSKSLHQATLTGKIEILELISNIGMQLSDGELLQLANAQQSGATEADYFNVIRKKTALLFASCSEIGGLSVNADNEARKHLRNFGEYLGICFQIKDDIFDYSENVKIGKPTGNDIRDGKVTLPLIHALRTAPEKERKQILHWIDNKDFSPENIQTITRFAHEYGGIEYAAQQMEIFRDKAIAELTGFPENAMKKALIHCAEFSASRNI